MKETVEKILAKYPSNKKDRLLSILQEVQENCGFLDDEILARIGDHLNIPSNKIFCVATFYDQFRFKHKGKNHIQVCNGTACYLFGSSTFLEELEKQLRLKSGNTSRDGRFSIEVVNCIGSCESAPVIRVNDVIHPKLSLDDLQKLIRSLKENS